ncbi:MAG: sulfotransferase domain-containing protein [Oricola sp.]
MPGILWLASYPKSGNTWMRAFLANLILDASEPLPLKRISELCPSEPSEIWFRPFVQGKVSDLAPKEVAALRCRAQERAVSLNKNVIPMKTHSYLGEDCGFPIISQKATFGAVYIIRDPRDVAISAADHFGLMLDAMIDKLADPLALCAAMSGTIVHELQSSWSHHVESWTRWNHPGIFTVRYEDLLADPLDQFGRVARHFGITTDKARVKKAIDFSSFNQLQKMEAEQGFVERSFHSERFFRSGRSGGWRDKLTPDQVARIESDHAVQMKRFGYL